MNTEDVNEQEVKDVHDDAQDQAQDQAQNDAAAQEAQPEEASASGEAGSEETTTDWQDKYLRLYAEFDNFRKRTMRELSLIHI